MNTYECTMIFSPELPAEKVEELVSKAQSLVENAEGKVLLTQQLGRKKLAYLIDKYREGVYVYMEISGSGALNASLENFFKVNDSIIRHLIVKVDKKVKKEKSAGKETKPEEVASHVSAESPAS